MAEQTVAMTRVERLPRGGMITLRADLETQEAADLLGMVGLALPEMRRMTTTEAGQVAWMSPDELLILCPPEAAPALAAHMSEACADEHMLVAEVSDARARFAVAGPTSRQTLAKLCPVDLAPGRFEPGEIRRTRLAQVACAFWMTSPDAFELICFRSVADYVETALGTAASHFDVSMSL